MMVLEIFYVAIGGGIGALVRLLLIEWEARKRPRPFSLALIWINLLGSFLLGYLFGLGISKEQLLFLGIGCLGGFTSLSTVHQEAMDLLEKKEKKLAILSLLCHYVGTILAAGLGYLLSG